MSDLGTNAVLRERAFDLIGNVTINVAETIGDNDGENEQNDEAGNRQGGDQGIAARQKTTTLTLRRLRLRTIRIALGSSFGGGRQRLIRLRLKRGLNFLLFFRWRRLR